MDGQSILISTVVVSFFLSRTGVPLHIFAHVHLGMGAEKKG
jgi:hypothetical protein